MSTTVKGEDVDDDLDVEDDDVNQYGEAQYSERDIVVNSTGNGVWNTHFKVKFIRPQWTRSISAATRL